MFMDYNFDYRGISNFCYLYVYIDDSIYKGWVRHLVTSEFNSRTPTITNEFLMDGNTIHRFVFNPLKYNYDLELPTAKFDKFAENSLDYKYVCGVPVPYTETFQCIWSQVKTANEEVMCACNIEEQVFLSVLGYDEDPTGTFVRVFVSNPSIYQFNEYSYFQDDTYGYYSKKNTPPNFRILPSHYFYYDTNLTPTLPAGLTQVSAETYTRVSIEQPLWMIIFYNINTIIKLVGTTITSTGDFTFYKRLSVSLNGINAHQLYYINIYDSDTTGLPYDTNNEFHGEENIKDATSYCYFKFMINGTDYYIQVYKGENSIINNSSLNGIKTYTGEFESAGYTLIKINGSLRFLPIYNKI